MFVPDATLDFHDLDIRTPYDIEHALTTFLEDEHARGSESVLIITGKGKGSAHGAVIKPHVLKLLPTLKLVESFKQAGYHNGGAGAFEVYLTDSLVV